MGVCYIRLTNSDCVQHYYSQQRNKTVDYFPVTLLRNDSTQATTVCFAALYTWVSDETGQNRQCFFSEHLKRFFLMKNGMIWQSVWRYECSTWGHNVTPKCITIPIPQTSQVPAPMRCLFTCYMFGDCHKYNFGISPCCRPLKVSEWTKMKNYTERPLLIFHNCTPHVTL